MKNNFWLRVLGIVSVVFVILMVIGYLSFKFGS